MEVNCFPVAFGLVVESGFPSLLLRKDGFRNSFFNFFEETHSLVCNLCFAIAWSRPLNKRQFVLSAQ